MNKLAALVVDVDTVVKVDFAALHVSGDAVAGCDECRSCNGFGRHLNAFGVEDLVNAVSKVHEVAGNVSLPSITVATGANRISQPRTCPLRVDGRAIANGTR